MITKIKRQDCLDKYPKFPQREYDAINNEEEFFYPKVFENYILTINSKSKKEYSNLLATELTSLTKYLGLKNLIFLGDNKNYWLTKLSIERDDYKPLQDALQYLIDNKVGKRFNGALEVNDSELPIFIKHLSCLIKCDASLPYFHFLDSRQNFIGSICQYGNIHLNTLNKKMDDLLKDAVSKSKFKFIKKC